MERLQGWDWRGVREMILTMDRDRFESAAIAWRVGRERLSRVVQNVTKDYERRGIAVLDYVRILEWHKDGFPHWHVLFHLDRHGAEGQINVQTVLDTWFRVCGGNLLGYIESEEHWRNKTGYWGKTGYFEKDKQHQVTLPEWMDMDTKASGTVRKIEGKRDYAARTAKGSGAAERAKRSTRRTYAAVFEGCGRTTILHTGSSVTRIPWPSFLVANALELMKAQGEEVSHVGWVDGLYVVIWADDNALTEERAACRLAGRVSVLCAAAAVSGGWDDEQAAIVSRSGPQAHARVAPPTQGARAPADRAGTTRVRISVVVPGYWA